MIDKRVIRPRTNGIRSGMLVVPREEGTRSMAWRGPHSDPGLVLDVVVGDTVHQTIAVVLVSGGRLLVPTESIRAVPESEEPTDELPVG